MVSQSNKMLNDGVLMKKTFKEYYQFTEEEFKKLWQECLFVFDANVLLNMYRFSVKTRLSFIKELK